MSKKLSIVIPSYNIEERIDRCLSSILESTANKDDYEVIVIDSSDKDKTFEKLKVWRDKHINLTVQHLPRKTPIGISRNLGVQKFAKGDYIYCIDGDDYLYDKDTLKHIIEGLDGKDIYYCPWFSLRDNTAVNEKADTIEKFANCSIGTMTKLYKRELYVPQPYYHPEDVCFHFLLIDKCKSVGCFDFTVYVYDNLPNNKGAISRTFDFCLKSDLNLLNLAFSNIIEKNNLKQEYITGVIHNLADMFSLRSLLKTPEVQIAWCKRFKNEYIHFMAGSYVH